MSKKKSQPVFTQCHGHLLELKHGKPVKCPTCSKKHDLTAQGYIKTENAPRSFTKTATSRARSFDVGIVEFLWFVSVLMVAWIWNMITTRAVVPPVIALAVMIWAATYFVTFKPKKNGTKK